MLISGGGGGAGSETDMAVWGMFILWGGWGSFGTDIGCVNIVGDRVPGAEFGDVNIWGVRVGGLGQISGMLILWGQGRGMGGRGTDIGDVNMGGGGVGDRNGYAHIMGVGVVWDRHWGC